MVTNLEAISQKLSEVKAAALETILSVSGSSAIQKNEYNVTVVDDTNTASSLLFKSLNKTKLDDTELVKAVDVVVKELAPNIPTPNLDLVPKPLYDEKVTENDSLRTQVTDLTNKVETLNIQITDLKSQVQTETNLRLSIEQTNDVLTNQLDALNKVITDFSNQIQSAVQKSVDESILRASLQSQNTGFKAQINALIKQIDSLNSIIEGLQSQLGAVQQQQAIQQSTVNSAAASGGDVINKVVIVTFEGPKEEPNYKLVGKLNPDNGDTKFVTGGTLRFVNNDTQPVTIEILAPAGGGLRKPWLILPKANFQIDGGKDEVLKLAVDKSAGDGIDPSYGGWLSGWGHSAGYDTPMTINVTRGDNSKDSKSYTIHFVKNNPKSF